MTSSSKKNSKVASKEASSAELEDFLVGNIDPEQYMIVNIATQYVYTYKNKKTGRKTTVAKRAYLNMETFDFQIQRIVYGTKRFYIGVRTGNLRQYIADLTKDYGENKKVDAQLNYESNVFACLIGAIVFSILFMVFSWIVRKIFNVTFKRCCVTKTKTVKVLDVDEMNNRKDWNVNDMSVKKEFKADETYEDIMEIPLEFLEKTQLSNEVFTV